MQRICSNFKVTLFSVLLLLSVSSCVKKVPSDVISQEKMEAILYDYHLARALGNELSPSLNYKQKLYEDYVFQKHGITAAEFDSSLSWYMRHTARLEEVYKNLERRLSYEKDEFQRQNPSELIAEDFLSPEGDSVDVWTRNRFHRLVNVPMANKLSFSLPADSNFHAGDTCCWMVKADFLGDGKDLEAVMAMSLHYADDANPQGKDTLIKGDGVYQLLLAADSAKGNLSEVIGYIYLYSPSSLSAESNTPTGEVLLLDEMQMIRKHQ